MGLIILQYITASSSVVQRVYYDSVAKEAADAGAVRGITCIKDNVDDWTTVKPIKPNTDCHGTAITGTTAPKWYMSHDASEYAYTSFSVAPMTITDNGVSFVSTGTVSFGRNDTITSTSAGNFTKTTHVDIPYVDTTTTWAAAQGTAVTKIAAGYQGSCAIGDQLPYCWGNNSYGALGVGGGNSSTAQRVNTGVLAGNTQVTSIDGGDFANCAIVKGHAACWGRRIRGYLGDGQKSDASIAPTYAVGTVASKNITKISMGDSTYTSCLLTEGTVYCTGGNDYGQTGQIYYNYANPCGFWPFPSCGTITGVADKPFFTTGPPSNVDADSGSFTPVFGYSNRPLESQSQLWGSRAIDVGTGAYGACALVNSGTFCWGDRSVLTNFMPWDVRKGNPTYSDGWRASSTTQQAIAVGESTGCTIISGILGCWGPTPGNGSVYALGNAFQYTSNGPGTALYNQAVTKVEAKNDQGPICSVANGYAICWAYHPGYAGWNTGTCLIYSCNATPQKATIDENSDVTDIASGRSHACAVANGSAYCWGNNPAGEVGANSGGARVDVPTKVAGIGLTSGYAATEISSGDKHNCAIINGRIFCWGDNSKGQLGTGDLIDRLVPSTANGSIPGRGATAISTGYQHTCAILNGQVWCWGDNSKGQLGTGDTTDRDEPTLVGGLLSGKKATAIAAGKTHTCAIAETNVYCWGNNATYQIGDNTTTQRNTPTLISTTIGSLNTTDITAGDDFTCAIANGKGYCWGNNASGQIGRSSSPTIGGTQKTPIAVDVLSTSIFTSIKAGNNFVCAVINGFAHCWGDNSKGQLGRGVSGNPANRYQVLRVGGAVTNANTTSLSVGNSRACSISNDVAYCWGDNTNGQLGDNTTTSNTSPTTVSVSGNNIYKIATGGTSSCAISNGKIACWGQGADGQIGLDHNSVQKLVPTWTEPTYLVGIKVYDYTKTLMY